MQASSGFGFGIVSVALLGLVLTDVRQATILPLLPNIAVTLWVLTRCYRLVDWHTTRPFLIASLSALPVGVLVLATLPQRGIHLGLAALLLISGLYGLIPQVSHLRWHRIWLGVPCGMLSGALSGAFNVGGPPAIAYFHNQNLPKRRYVASLQTVFLSSGILRLILLSSTGLMNWSIATVSAATGAFAIVGAALGLLLLRVLSQKTQRIAVSVAQLVLAMVYLRH